MLPQAAASLLEDVAEQQLQGCCLAVLAVCVLNVVVEELPVNVPDMAEELIPACEAEDAVGLLQVGNAVQAAETSISLRSPLPETAGVMEQAAASLAVPQRLGLETAAMELQQSCHSTASSSGR